MATVSMPQLGESVTEGTIGRWLKQPGEKIEKYEPLVEVTTDKVNAEIPSPYEGILQEITVPEGETVRVGTHIAVIAAEGEAAPTAPASDQATTPVPFPMAVTNQAAGEAQGPASPAAVAEAAEVAGPTDATVSAAARTEPDFGSPAGGTGADGAGERGGRRRFTPLVLRLAEQHNIPLDELGRIPGSGLGGRISKNDVLRYLETRPAAPPAAAPQPVAPPRQPAPLAATTPATGVAPAPGQVVPLTPMRKAIAEHMVRSVTTSPHAWTMVEVDMTTLAKYRATHKDEFARREGFSLTYLPFFIEAVVAALKEFPILNATWTERGIELKQEIGIGVAVALEHQQGLLVPVIRRADERNIVGLARVVHDLATRARTNKLTPDDLHGGTFTVNNPGSFGSILSQPIINQPQAAILTMEAIVKRPVVLAGDEGDVIAIRQMMNVCLSFDHRILDGLTAGQFLAALKGRLERFAGSPGL